MERKKMTGGCTPERMHLVWKRTMFLIVMAAALLTGSIRVWADENLKTASFTASDDAQFFIAYIYVADDEENPYNYHERDITLHFGEYYITAKYTDYADTDLYKNFGYVRVHGYLPKDRTYFPSMDTSDSTFDRFSYRVMYDGMDISSGEGAELKTGNNEFFFVGGFTGYVHGESGKKKMQELYDNCHTQDGGFYGNKAAEIIEKRQEYEEMAEQLNGDPSLDSIAGFYGDVYTRQDLRDLGCTVALGDSEKASSSPAADESQETPGSSVIPGKPDGETIGRADRVFHFSGLLVFIFLLPLFAAAGFGLYRLVQWHKRRKEDENTYID